MTEQRALVPTQVLTMTTWEMIRTIAPVIHQSRLFGVNSEAQAAAVMLKGFELGLGLASSFELIHVVQGKPTLSPRGALALIQRSGELVEMRVEDQPERCTVFMRRRNGFSYTLTYTLDEARRAGLVKLDSAWVAYGPNMLRWRAIGFCADVVFPDIMGGMKRADEMGAAVDITGEVIYETWQHAVEQTASQVDAEALDELVTTYGADAVMAACNGQIPTTLEAIKEAAVALAAQASEVER